MTKKITQFKDEYSWLSNFHYLTTPLVYDGMTFKTVEHFYVAMKTLNKGKRLEVAQHPLKGLKKLGRSLELRGDWEAIKIKVMKFALVYKFSNNNPCLRQKLIETGDVVIEEGNWWNDTFWGICLKTNTGENNLGKLLMVIREEIKRDKEN